MSKIVLELTNVSKQYKLGLVRTRKFRDFISNFFSNAKKEKSNNYLWALKDVNFKLHEGEILGVIGHNGAGKSTFLKLLSRVTTPTTGQIKIWGQIASLLEVGTGFHNELTGRENVYLNGAILGMKRKVIKLRIDEIIDFSGISQELIDTPIKKYSSGMKVRLAFAVAIYLKANILLMDEVLAVSDLEFQEKSLNKLQQLVSEGKTIIFVSHDLDNIESLCNKCILIEKGKLVMEGKTSEVIKYYREKESV